MRLSKGQVMEESCLSRSQLYKWQRGEQLQRKERAQKVLSEETTENAVGVIRRFPYMGGRKGQAYMLYHQRGYISQKAYDRIKKSVKRLFMQEIDKRKLFAQKEPYEHQRPKGVTEVWAEDFTDIRAEGVTFKVALLVDVFDGYYLGHAVGQRATAALVRRPVEQALEASGGKGPEKFLLSDNGSQYRSQEHGALLRSAEIVHRLIPRCVPQYNGTAECGMRHFKSVFYNVWEESKRNGADKGKSLLERVQEALAETVTLLNNHIPRPQLEGVTPADVHFGRKAVKLKQIRQYRREEEARRDVAPWKRNYWEVLKSGLGLEEMSDGELLTKAAFFWRRPLRRIAQRNRESVG